MNLIYEVYEIVARDNPENWENPFLYVDKIEGDHRISINNKIISFIINFLFFN